MMYKQAFAAGLAVFLFISAVSAQKAEVTISLNEPFFDSLLDSVFQNFAPPEFSVGENKFKRVDAETQRKASDIFWGSTSFAENSISTSPGRKPPLCGESIKILREMNGVRTAVRFRDGKVYVPLAFSGNYLAPLLGCVEFAGWAESNIDLEFDQQAEKLIGRVRVLNVNLNGTNGIGGTVIARLIQTSVDKRLNPIEIISLDKVSFGFPMQKSGNLRMKALRIRPEISTSLLNIRVDYEFVKG